jgi:transcriptional regulator with XRE-family HTH domain
MTDTTGESWFSAETSTFGDRLAGAREAAGLSQADLAQRLGVRDKTVAAWENDATDPRANRLQMLAGMLGVSIRWLLTGEGEGLEKPADQRLLSPAVQDALSELERLRAMSAMLSANIGHVERRLRSELRAEAE